MSQISKMMSQLRATPRANEVDARNILPAERHNQIFRMIHKLAVGVSFVLINDHDTQPLRRQLQSEYPHQFFWNYLEEGPDVWRIHIGRLQQAA